MTLSVSLGLCNRSANFSVSPCKPYCSLSLPDPESPGFRPVLPLLLTRFHSTNRLQRPPRVRRGTDSESHPSGLPCAELPSGTADQMLALKSQFTGDPRFTGRPVRSRRGRNPQRWNVRRPFVPASREDLDDRLPIWSGVCLRFFVFFFLSVLLLLVVPKWSKTGSWSSFSESQRQARSSLTAQETDMTSLQGQRAGHLLINMLRRSQPQAATSLLPQVLMGTLLKPASSAIYWFTSQFRHLLAGACKTHPVTGLPSARVVVNVGNHSLGGRKWRQNCVT